MRRSAAFEAALAVMLVLLIFVIYPMATMTADCLAAGNFSMAGHNSASYVNAVARPDVIQGLNLSMQGLQSAMTAPICVAAMVRAKVNKNDNRDAVMNIITESPGLTLPEIARGTDMNIGTARYHLAILGAGHHIVSNKSDGKYIRYFTNSGSYTKDEQFFLSLLRREGVGNVLQLMLEKPGISNADIGSELQMDKSAVSRYMKELSSMGIVSKTQSPDGRSFYFNQRSVQRHDRVVDTDYQ